jgi:hypothetical protein
MRFAVVCIMALWGAMAWATEAPAQTAEWMRQREQIRKQRSEFEQEVEDNRKSRAEKAARIIAELLIKAKEYRIGRDDHSLRDLIAGVRFLHPAVAEPLDRDFASFTERTESDPKQTTAWCQLVEKRRRDVLKPTENLFNEADKVGSSLTRECVDQALKFWPEHPRLRRNLGQTRIADRWYGPREAEIAKGGLIWDDHVGWIVEQDRARYTQGEYFDLTTKTWSTLDEADARHRVLDNQWVILTEHLELRGTAKLIDLIQTANQLEAFYDRVFAAYASFFVKPADKRGVGRKPGVEPDIKLLFGMLDHPRLVINVARDEAGYRNSLPPGVEAGWSAGMFISRTKQSYFYAGYSAAVYHEFTHQILHLFTGENRAPAWLVEGAAVYTQAPVFYHGRMELGIITENHHISSYFLQRAEDKALPFSRILQMEDSFAWSRSKTPELNYPAVGALVQYCMESDHRAHRADFVDFLRDSYQGQTRGYHLWDYLGMDYERLEKNFTAWADEQSHAEK